MTMLCSGSRVHNNRVRPFFVDEFPSLELFIASLSAVSVTSLLCCEVTLPRALISYEILAWTLTVYLTHAVDSPFMSGRIRVERLAMTWQMIWPTIDGVLVMGML